MNIELTQEEIDEFKAIYKKEYEEELLDDEAREMGMRLVRTFEVMLDQKCKKSCSMF